jgi:hypothetical protein
MSQFSISKHSYPNESNLPNIPDSKSSGLEIFYSNSIQKIYQDLS